MYTLTMFKCSDCGSYYSHRQSLYRHHKSTHRGRDWNKNQNILQFKCSVCSCMCRKKSDLLSHFHNVHDIDVTTETKTFESFDHFKQWKTEYEVQNVVKYILMFGSEKVKPNGTAYYTCHRSGYFKTRGKGIRHVKTQGSKKIDGFCPSQIKVSVNADGKCVVVFTPSHVGHQNELAHMLLTQSERSSLAAKIAEKIPFSTILDEIRDGLTTPDELQRVHLLTRKDLYNIKSSFNLSSESGSHTNDAMSVEAWVNGARGGTDDCVLFYKPQGDVHEEYPNLSKSDFILAIMNDAQASVLEKYGGNAVCIDGTHGLNACDFELVTLIIIDDMPQGFPCAFLFTNRTDKEVLQIFFSKIKDRVGTVSPNVFMSNMADSFFNAWMQVMGEPAHRLYCSWHIDQAWRKNLTKVESNDKQTETYKILTSLMQERDLDTFNFILEAAVRKMVDDPETSEYGNYFKETYASTAQYWAYCHRLHWDVNSNTHIENLHKCLKHIYLQGKRIKHLVKSIYALMMFLREKMYDRIIIMHEDKVMSKIRDLRQRHNRSQTLRKDLVVKEGNIWKIPSLSGTVTYTIAPLKENCDCQLFCNECNSCIHSYSCTCIDSAIKFNMCKHIHLVCQLRADVIEEERSQSSEEYEEDECSEELHIWTGNEEIGNEKEALLQQISRKEYNKGTTAADMDRKLELKKQNLLSSSQKLIQNLTSIEEAEALERLLISIEPTLAAVRAGVSREEKNTSTKRKIEPQQGFSSTKKKKVETISAISKPSAEEQEVITLNLISSVNIEGHST